MLKWIFSIGNDNNFQKNKFIVLFGFKIYLDTFKFKSRSLPKMEYYTYLENNLNQDKSSFIGITNAPYKVNGGGDCNNIKLIAYYLPQFHTIPLNDENFGKGSTECNQSYAFICRSLSATFAL